VYLEQDGARLALTKSIWLFQQTVHIQDIKQSGGAMEHCESCNLSRYHVEKVTLKK
jgi:hypothetical protein